METLSSVKAAALAAAQDEEGSVKVYPPGADMRMHLPLFARYVPRVFIGKPDGPPREAVPVINALTAYHEKIRRYRQERSRVASIDTVSHVLTNDEAAAFMRAPLSERVSMAQARIAGRYEATGRRVHRPEHVVMPCVRPDAHLGGVGGE